MNEPICTYVFCPISPVYIRRALYTLYKYQNPKDFKVVVVDQVKGGFPDDVMEYIRPLTHLYLHPCQRQLGFSKAMNEGAIHGLRWGSKYICLANDDIELINSRFFSGIEATFAKDERIIGVVPMSSRVAGWGYGVDYNPEVLPYKEEYTDADYDYLLNADFSSYKGPLPKTFPVTGQKGTVVDGAVFIMPFFKREAFEKVGFLDEHYFPGSGEDVDYCARAYKLGLRIVSTSYSWVFHHWSKSKDLFASGELEDEYYKPYDKPYWNNQGDLWPEGFDVWARKPDGTFYPRTPEVFVDQI
jgi:GT2 family glycosyltransferase